MSAEVWPYHRAECARPGCEWAGDLHLSGGAALEDAMLHDRLHDAADDLAAALLNKELNTPGPLP